MTVSPPKVNGHVRPPALPVMGDWQPIGVAAPEPAPEVAEEQPEFVAQAQAEAVRAKAWADAEEQRIKAEAEAEAIRVKAAEDARKQRLANDRAERKSAEEQAASAARIAEHNRRRDASERGRLEDARQAEEARKSETATAAEIVKAEGRWAKYARAFYIVCAIVALPVQVAAFYNPDALWLMAAPLMLEGGAWVVLKGAAAAVAAGRPHWHYRLIAWLLAFIAAGINLWHGLNAFDPATAIGTAFASVAGPGVWDLHEHGRIRKADGTPTRRERRDAEKKAKAEAAAKAADEERQRAEKTAADKAAKEAAEQLDAARAEEFPDVWEEAERIAAAVGEVDVTEKVWARAYRNIKGAEPGESIESITARRAAEKRVEAALTGTPVNTLSKTTNAQRAIQTPRSGYKPVPPRRKRGDTPRYNRVAGRAHGDLLRAKNASSRTTEKKD
jgi:hypothetical protein